MSELILVLGLVYTGIQSARLITQPTRSNK